MTEKTLTWHGYVEKGRGTHAKKVGCTRIRTGTERKAYIQVERLVKNRESLGLKMEDVLDRTKWNRYAHNHSGDPDDGKSPRRRTSVSIRSHRR